MKAFALEYRLRYGIHALIFVLGFWAPWNLVLHLDPPGPNAHVWGILAANMSQAGLGDISSAFVILLSLGIFFAVLGAWIRTWGAAYLSTDVVQGGGMHTALFSNGILEDGPFRFVRNPLYLGTFCHTLALALLMPRSGAIFAIVAVGVMQIRLILAEESFLKARLGAPYEAYCTLVPRLLPTLRPKVKARGLVPRWTQAFIGEIYFWGVAGSYAFAGWHYNASLLMQCVLVSFGVALVARALMPTAKGPDEAVAAR